MRQLMDIKFLILLIILALPSVIVYSKIDSKEIIKAEKLENAIQNLNQWKSEQEIDIEVRIKKLLQLDDYYFASYSNGANSVTLFVGYYFSKKKLGAAHDPLVCFPGQGWKLSAINTSSYSLQKNPTYNIKYKSMVADLGTTRTYVLYWFQAYDTAHPTTYKQKYSLFWKKLKGIKGENAFVRITVPMEMIAKKEAHEIAVNFIESFYPSFMDYIKK
jgi:EpsI family protein